MFVQLDGRPDGPPVLLLHGFCGSSRWYDPVVQHLDPRCRIIRVDLLGHGRTGGRAADAPVQARAVRAVLDRLQVADVTVVGHSFGADVATELAEHCARVSSLVILCQAPDYSDANLPAAAALVSVPVLGTGLIRAGRAMAGGLLAVTSRRSGSPLAPLLRQGLRDFRALDPAMFAVVVDERGERLVRRPLDAQVRASGLPTLVVLGGRDHFYGARSAGRYRAAGARVEILPECGHSPLVEDPERTAQLITEFLPALPAPTAS